MSVLSRSAAPGRATRRADRARCLSSDMLLIHKVFRREYGMLATLVAGVGAGRTQRAAVVAAHARELGTALRHHHDAEQDLLWPRVRERANLASCIEESMRAGQREHLALLRELDGLLPLWEQAADTDLRDTLVDIFGELAVLLNAHLDASEEFVLSAVDEHFTNGEWLALGLRAAGWIPLHRMAWMLGAMLEDATPAERDNLLGKVPAPARLLYRMVGQEQYVKEMRELRASA